MTQRRKAPIVFEKGTSLVRIYENKWFLGPNHTHISLQLVVDGRGYLWAVRLVPLEVLGLTAD